MRCLFFFVLIFYSEIAKTENLPTSGTLLWRISGNGLSENSYLYGTMHSRDKRAFRFGDSVISCLMRCKTMAMELKLDELNREEMVSNMMMDSGQTIKNYLTKNQYDSIEQKIKTATGLPLSLFERIKPIYIATMIAQNEMLYDSANRDSNSFFLDEYFEWVAKHAGKNVYALEELQTQLDIFNFFSTEQQIAMLMKSICEANDKSSATTFINEYINGELEILLTNENNEVWPIEFMNKILYERNSCITNKIELLIKNKSTFSAFGAAHLTGDLGVISLLRKKGFTVEPVEASYDNITEEGWLYVYPYSVISVSMPGIPVFLNDTLLSSKIIYQKWTSTQSNNYVVAHFDKSVSMNKLLLEKFASTEINSSLILQSVKNKFTAKRNIKTYAFSRKLTNGNAFIIENGNEKIAVLVYKDSLIDTEELKRFLSLIRYKISSVIPN